jgi:hypothetical protein
VDSPYLTVDTQIHYVGSPYLTVALLRYSWIHFFIYVWISTKPCITSGGDIEIIIIKDRAKKEKKNREFLLLHQLQ